jgi:hypothetical protein
MNSQGIDSYQFIAVKNIQRIAENIINIAAQLLKQYSEH